MKYALVSILVSYCVPSYAVEGYLCKIQYTNATRLYENLSMAGVEQETILANARTLYIKATLCTESCEGDKFKTCSSILAKAKKWSMAKQSSASTESKIGKQTYARPVLPPSGGYSRYVPPSNIYPNGIGGFYDNNGNVYNSDALGGLYGSDGSHLYSNGIGGFYSDDGAALFPDGLGGYYSID